MMNFYMYIFMRLSLHLDIKYHHLLFFHQKVPFLKLPVVFWVLPKR